MFRAHACTPRQARVVADVDDRYANNCTATIAFKLLLRFKRRGVKSTDGCCAVVVWLLIMFCEMSGRRRYVGSIVNLYQESF